MSDREIMNSKPNWSKTPNTVNFQSTGLTDSTANIIFNSLWEYPDTKVKSKKRLSDAYFHQLTFPTTPLTPITPEEFVWYVRGLMDSELTSLARQQALNPDSTIELIPTLDKLFRKLNQVK